MKSTAIVVLVSVNLVAKKNQWIFNTVGRALLQTFNAVSVSQRDHLEQLFAKDQYPTKSTIHEIAEELGMDERKVYNWFHWQRAKARSGKRQLTMEIGEFVANILVKTKV